jgi:beta-xylosidase
VSAAGGTRAGGGASASGTTKTAGGTSAVSSPSTAAGSSSVGGRAAAGGTSAAGGAVTATCPATYKNPVIWQDLPDVEVIRVDDTYYYTASSFHYSPGAPLLRSYDLVNWEFLGHSVPVLDFDASYNLSGKRSYVNGIWASSLRYRKSNNTFYWIGCMHNVGGGYMFTATSPEGPWTKHTAGCYYDVGLLIDDDDTMYVAYGNTTLNVAQLSKDGFSQVKSQKVFDSPSDIGALEGSRFYKINGDYYIFTTQYANGEYVLRSSSGPFGPYTLQKFAVKLPFAGTGAGASPHQGGIVETQNGDWYYMAFNDSYPAGRIPVLAPVTWKDGWPSVTLSGSAWGASYPFPNLPCGAGRVKPMTGTDTFEGAALEPHWEWNHNPDNTKWSSGSGLTLSTATVTKDLYAARNTLTRRMIGPTSTATIELDYTAMKDGDVAGLAALRDASARIGVSRTGDAFRVSMVNNLTLDADWNTSSTGTEVAGADVSGGKIWLRIAANVRTDSGGGQAVFYYSTDGTKFSQLGSAFTMKKDWPFFLGYRFAIFNYATLALGGSVKVASFRLESP